MDRIRWDDQAFKTWLEQQTQETIVGQTATPCDCPLARWQASLGHTVEVQFNYVFGLRGQDKILIPYWATRFIYECDALGPEQPVTCEQALNALKTALE